MRAVKPIGEATFAKLLGDIGLCGNVAQVLREHKIAENKFYALALSDEAHRQRYYAAKMAGLEAFADQTVAAVERCRATKNGIAKARLVADVRKWHLSHMLPKKYGARTIVAGDADDPLRVVTEDAASVRSRLLSGVAAGGATGATGEAER